MSIMKSGKHTASGAEIREVTESITLLVKFTDGRIKAFRCDHISEAERAADEFRSFSDVESARILD